MGNCHLIVVSWPSQPSEPNPTAASFRDDKAQAQTESDRQTLALIPELKQ